MDPTVLRLVCAAIAVAFGALIVMRRRSHKEE
jgi:hypothetical protein